MFFGSVFQSRFGLVSSVLAVGRVHFALIICYLLLSGPSVTMFEMGPLQSNFRRPFKNSNTWFSCDYFCFAKLCCPLSSPLLQIKMEKTYYLQDHSAKSTWWLWIFTWPFSKFTWTLFKSKIYMYCGVTSSPMLVLIICCICLVLSAHKDPTYSWWLQRPLVNSLGYHILLLIARREYIMTHD